MKKFALAFAVLVAVGAASPSYSQVYVDSGVSVGVGVGPGYSAYGYYPGDTVYGVDAYAAAPDDAVGGYAAVPCVDPTNSNDVYGTSPTTYLGQTPYGCVISSGVSNPYPY